MQGGRGLPHAARRRRARGLQLGAGMTEGDRSTLARSAGRTSDPGPRKSRGMIVPPAYWARPAAEVAAALGVGLAGLTTDEAERRLALAGPNELHPRGALSRLRVLWRQVRSPLVLLLVFAALASAVTGEWSDALIVAAILFASVGVGYRREYRAETSIAALLDRIQVAASVVRDGARAAGPAARHRPRRPRRAVGGQHRAGGCRAGRDDRAPRRRVDAHRRELPGRQARRARSPRPPRSRDAPRLRATPARTCAAAPRGHSSSRPARRTAFGAIAARLAAHAPETEFERGLRRFGTAAARRDARDRRRRVRGQRAARAPAGRDAAVLDRARRRAQPRAAARDRRHQPGPRRRAPRGRGRARPPARRDREPRQHGRAVHRQDRHAHRGRGPRRGRVRSARARPSDAVMELAVSNATLQTGLANPIDAALVQAAPWTRARCGSSARSRTTSRASG